MGAVHHLHDGQPGSRRELDAPGLLEFYPRFVAGHLLVGGIDIGQGAHVTGPLDVVLPPEGIDAAALDPYVAAEHGQVGDGFHVVRTGYVLGDSHGVEDGGPFGPAVHPGGGAEIFRGDPGDFLHIFRGVFLHDLLQGREALGAFLHIFLVI